MGRKTKHDVAAEVWRHMVGFTLGKVQRGTHHELLREHGLTPGHLKVLGILDPSEPKPMGVVAERIPCDASQMTWLTDRLEDRGLVERRLSPADRRVRTIALTSKGISFRERLLADLFSPPEELLTLDAGTLDELLATMRELGLPDPMWPAVAGGPAR
jgi:DNA-binding MarR family transcriptional regulator